MSRQGANTQGQGQRQELVFCHQCENEWYNNGDPTGLTCPQCGSDFTELIDNDFDPRAAQTAQQPSSQHQHPLHDHNPWANAPDPDEEDIGAFGALPQHRNTFGNPFGFDHQQQHGAPPYDNPIFGIMQTIMGNGMGPPQPFARRVQRDGVPGRPQGGGGPFGGNFGGQQQQEQQQQQQQQEQGHGQTRSGNWQWQRSGPGYTVTFSNGPMFAMGSGRTTEGQQMPQPDLEEMLNGLFGSMGGMPGARGPGGHPAFAHGPFAGLFGDPARAQTGDAVFSQEALDRVISQLMEQHPGGSAPGPASRAAIESLPKKKLDVDMLDENTGQAECSICMDNVDIGEEITLLPCKHWFHFDCIKAWLESHDTCPVCRSGIMPKDGNRDAPRAQDQAPLHDQGPARHFTRQESGSRDHPFLVDESPSRARRAPNSQGQQARPDSSSGAGITDRIRDWFTGGGGT